MYLISIFLLVSLQVDHLAGAFIQGEYRQLRMTETRLYFCTGRGLEIYDYATASNPQLVGLAATDGLATGIDVDVLGNHVYVTDLHNGLVIFDISDPTQPMLVGHYDTEGFAEDIVVKDTLAFVADGDQGLVILDVSDVSNPRYLGSWTQDDYYAVTVHVSDTLVYLGNISNDPLKIICIADPANPYFVANFPQNQAPGNTIIGAYVVDTLAFCTGSWWMTNPEGYYHFLVANVRDPANPLFVSRLAFDLPAMRSVVEGDYAYVNAQEEGVRIVDISDPAQPVEVGHFDESITTGYGSAVHGNILVVPQLLEGFSIVDVTVPPQPIRLFRKRNYGWQSFAVNETPRYLYLYGNARMETILHTSLMLVDIADVVNMLVRSVLHFLGTRYTGHTGPGLIIAYPYLAFGLKRAGNFLGVVDVSDVDNPELMRFEPGTTCGPSAMSFPGIYAGGDDRLMIGDILAEPFWIDSLATPGRCYDVEIRDSIAYAACNNKLAILNLNSDTLLATYFHGHWYAGSNGGISLDYPYFYMSYCEISENFRYYGFLVFDVSNPSMPLLVTDTMVGEPIPGYDFIGIDHSCYLRDSLLFLCRGKYGFGIWNVSDPTVPIRILTHDTPYGCRRIHVVGDTIFVMERTSVEVYHMHDTGAEETSSRDVVVGMPCLEVFPNPFKDKTAIRYHIAQPTLSKTRESEYQVRIFDVSGRLVRTLSLPIASTPASTTINWDGTDAHGRKLAQGIYFITLDADGSSLTTKVTMLR